MALNECLAVRNESMIILNECLMSYIVPGREADPKQLKAMVEESPGQLNFTHFLNLFGSNVAGKLSCASLRVLQSLA